MEAIGDQDCTRRASAYAKLAEEPSNLDFREQYLHLARAWMDLALERGAAARIMSSTAYIPLNQLKPRSSQ